MALFKATCLCGGANAWPWFCPVVPRAVGVAGRQRSARRWRLITQSYAGVVMHGRSARWPSSTTVLLNWLCVRRRYIVDGALPSGRATSEMVIPASMLMAQSLYTLRTGGSVWKFLAFLNGFTTSGNKNHSPQHFCSWTNHFLITLAQSPFLVKQEKTILRWLDVDLLINQERSYHSLSKRVKHE